MKRICVICEGPTEVRFVKDCLLPYCWEEAGQMLTATVISGKDHQHRGGNVSAERLARTVWRQIPNYDGVTTLVDYYGFKHLGTRTKADVEADILQSLARDCHCGDNELRKVLPYVQMHEFEGLLFSDVSVFPFVLDDRWSEELQKALEAVAAAFETPEDINNGVETAPSKRLMKLVPAYDKILDGGPLAKYIGIATMRRRCPGFNAWVERLLTW